MMKPKVALVKDGFLPPGSENRRGRLSVEAKARLATLAQQGWSIEGYSKDSPAKPVTSRKSSPKEDSSGVVDVPEPYRDENAFEAYHEDDGRMVPVGMKTACNTCGSSLTYCPCPHPKVWDGMNREVLVQFKVRTTPVVKKWW